MASPVRMSAELGAATKHQVAHQERPHEAQSNLTRQDAKDKADGKVTRHQGKTLPHPLQCYLSEVHV